MVVGLLPGSLPPAGAGRAGVSVLDPAEVGLSAGLDAAGESELGGLEGAGESAGLFSADGVSAGFVYADEVSAGFVYADEVLAELDSVGLGSTGGDASAGLVSDEGVGVSYVCLINRWFLNRLWKRNFFILYVIYIIVYFNFLLFEYWV